MTLPRTPFLLAYTSGIDEHIVTPLDLRYPPLKPKVTKGGQRMRADLITGRWEKFSLEMLITLVTKAVMHVKLKMAAKSRKKVVLNKVAQTGIKSFFFTVVIDEPHKPLPVMDYPVTPGNDNIFVDCHRY